MRTNDAGRTRDRRGPARGSTHWLASTWHDTGNTIPEPQFRHWFACHSSGLAHAQCMSMHGSAWPCTRSSCVVGAGRPGRARGAAERTTVVRPENGETPCHVWARGPPPRRLTGPGCLTSATTYIWKDSFGSALLSRLVTGLISSCWRVTGCLAGTRPGVSLRRVVERPLWVVAELHTGTG